MSTGDEHIEVVNDVYGDYPWAPAEGEETANLLLRTFPNDQTIRQSVLMSARDILSYCVPPTEDSGQQTELVVGYIQSGKTLSFTTVAALANDNGYRMIIVIAGTTRDLAEQSQERLLSDLALEESPFSSWHHFHNPGPGDVNTIRDLFTDWDDPDVEEDERRTVLITVLKNHRRLETLIGVINQLGDHAHVPVLIIDDEADQASLNNLVRDDDLSTTYRRVLQLKDSLQHHSFIQYTATPQANLLINLIDVLSPDRAFVLAPGNGYVGGATFFADGSPYVQIIPPGDIPQPDRPLTEPPDSLLEALQLFFVGVASGYHRGREGRPKNRSMMVHPSRLIAGHQQFFRWIETIRSMWMDILSQRSGEDYDLLVDEFRQAHADLDATMDDLEPFNVLRTRLLRALRRTQVRCLNSVSDTRTIRWGFNYSWILVGGQVLDRGFTIEGLTVTYMPRGPGVGNADTIQQRARFLGYKQEYLGFCRVFLDATVFHAYRVYVTHEEDIRNRLIVHNATGQPLSEFRRIFICDRALRPTRQSILGIDFQRPTFRNGWYSPQRPPLSESHAEASRCALQSFFQREEVDFQPDTSHQDEGDDRTVVQKHFVTQVPLQLAYDELLSRIVVGDMEEDYRWIVTLVLLDRYLSQNPDATCTIYQMSRGVVRRRQVRDGRILNLFQGAHPVGSGHIYPGDREIKGEDNVTIQVHNVTFFTRNDNVVTDVICESPAVTVWMAQEVQLDVVVQDQGQGS